MFTELRLHSKQRSLTLCTIRCDWASLYGTTLTELLVLTDFGVCLLVELICYLFSDGERGERLVKRSRGCGSLLAHTTVAFWQQACYVCTFTEEFYRRYMEETVGSISYLHVSNKYHSFKSHIFLPL